MDNIVLHNYNEINILKNKSNKRSLNQLFILCIVLLIVYVLITILDIFSLCNNNIYYIRNICYKSRLWEFLLFNVLLNVVQIFILKLILFNIRIFKYSNLLIYIIPLIGVTMWGYNEFWYVNCVNNISITYLYKISYIQFIIDCIGCVLYTIIIIYYFVNIYVEKNKLEKSKVFNIKTILEEINSENIFVL